MKISTVVLLWLAVAGSLFLTGCATTQQTPFDYSSFKQSNPKSILVLPPLNNTPDVRATHSLLAQVTQPLAESGYYVIPVALMDETLRENGVTQPTDAHALSSSKLREIFGADTGLYITVTNYGTKFMLVDSVTTVSAEAKLVDLRTEQVIWTGKASANSAEQRNQQSGGGLLGMVISAVINQIASNIVDSGHQMAGVTSQRLLRAGSPNGLLHGPRSPKYMPN